MSKLRQIALYGKGGIGKSTIASNLSIAFSELGETVFQVGCSPKIDSTALLNHGRPVYPTVLEYLVAHSASPDYSQDFIKTGYRGIYLAETGGPEPAEGCAGKGVAMALEYFKNINLYGKLGVTYVVYDVIGDIVCGGFALPIRSGYAQEVYIVTSGELMSLYSANNVCSAIKTFADSRVSKTRLGGIISNMRGVPNETEVVEAFCAKLGVPCMAHIPRSKTVQEAEARRGSALEIYPNTPQADAYRKLAEKIYQNAETFVPKPMMLEEITELMREFQIFE